MAFLKVKNRAFSTLASGVSDVATEWTVATGEGAKFPTTGDFHVTCEDEIVKCTSRTGDVLTVVREQEGTTGAAHTAGKAVELRITAGIIEELQSPFALPKLVKASNFIMIPTAAGWTEVVTGAGESGQEPMRNWVGIGDTNAGSALLRTVAYGFNVGGIFTRVNWDKHIYIIFNYAIHKTEAGLTRRIQVKQSTNLGQLGELGFGIQVVNLAIIGESYGIARGTVSLGNMVLDSGDYYKEIQVIIELNPDTPAVNFYINGSLTDSITNTDHIPSGIGANSAYLFNSIDRSGSGLIDPYSLLFHGKIWQEL